MDSSGDVQVRWAEGLRAAAARAYAAGHGTDPPEPRVTRWRVDVRTAVTAAVAIAVLGACVWWGLRDSTPAAVLASAVPTASASARGEPAAVLVVHVSGAVAEPGLVELASGARVADAVELAGGLTRRADEASVNLARTVEDGEHIVVARVGERDASPLIDLNSADATALEGLPGVGPVLAARIVQDRKANGPFRGLEDLARVSGVGPAILSGLDGVATT